MGNTLLALALVLQCSNGSCPAPSARVAVVQSVARVVTHAAAAPACCTAPAARLKGGCPLSGLARTTGKIVFFPRRPFRGVFRCN